MDWDEFTADIEKAISTRLDTVQSNIDSHHEILKSTISKLNSFTTLLQEKFPAGLFPITEAKKQLKPPVSNHDSQKSIHPINHQNKESKVLHTPDKKDTPSKSEEAKKKVEEAKRKKEEEDLKKKENLAKKQENEEKKKEENKKKSEEVKEKKRQEEIEKKKQEDLQKKVAEEQKAKKKLVEEEKKIKKEGDVKKKAVEDPKKSALVGGEEKKQEAGKSKIAPPRGLRPPTSLPKPKANVPLQKSPSRDSLKSESPVQPEVPIPKYQEPEPTITEILVTPESPILLETPVIIEKPIKQDSPVQIKSPVHLENPKEHSSFSNRRSSFNSNDSLLDTKPENFSEPSKTSPRFLKRSSISVTLHSQNEDWTSQNFLSRTFTDPQILAESLARSVIPAEISQDQISVQIQILEGHYSESDLNTEKKFDLSVGAKSALSLLTTMDDEKFHLNKVPKEEVIWSFRLFFRFIGKNLNEDPNLAWSECQEFIKNARDKELNKKSVDKVVLDVINNFDFSDGNLDLIEEFIKGKEQFLQPQYYTELCPMTGLFMFAIREASIFAGVIKGKIPIWRQYKRLLHKRQQIVG